MILVNGRLTVFLRRGNPALRISLPDEEPDRSQIARAVAQKLAEVARQRQSRRGGLLVGTINDLPAGEHFMARFLEESGFVSTAGGFQMRRIMALVSGSPQTQDGDTAEDRIEPKG